MSKKKREYIVTGVLLGIIIFLFIVMMTLLCDADEEVYYIMYEPIPVEEVTRHYKSAQIEICIAEQEEQPTNSPYEFIKLDDDLQIYLEERCADMNLDFFVMASLMFSESSFKVSAYGDEKIGGSVGLFQINKVWWDYMEDNYGLDVFQPKDNIDAGLIIYKKLLDKSGSDEMAIQYYKCGESRGRKLAKQGKMLSSIKGILDRADEWRLKAKE